MTDKALPPINSPRYPPISPTAYHTSRVKTLACWTVDSHLHSC